MEHASRHERRAAEQHAARATELEALRGPDVLADGTDKGTFRKRHGMPPADATDLFMRYATSIDRRTEKDVATFFAIQRQRLMREREGRDEVQRPDTDAHAEVV